MLKVTLVHSLIACKPDQKATAASMGLRKIGDCIVAEDTPALQGKIKKIVHLLKVEKTEA